MRRVLAHHVLVFSDVTFSELKTRLWKPKLDRYLSLETRSALLHDFNAAAYWVKIPPELAAQTFSRDPDDDMFVHAALARGAPFLISGDLDLLAPASQFKKHRTLGIFAPAKALDMIPGGA